MADETLCPNCSITGFVREYKHVINKSTPRIFYCGVCEHQWTVVDTSKQGIDPMKVACSECGASGVWTRLTDVKHERGAVVTSWRCLSCGHVWTVETARPKPPRASLRPRRGGRRA